MISAFVHFSLHLLALPTLSLAACNDNQNNCLLCTASYSLTLAACRWCPKDDKCHEYGSLTSPCSSDEAFSTPGSCPAPSPEPDVYDESVAKTMLAYAAAGYCSPSKVAAWNLGADFCRDPTSQFEVDATVYNRESLAFGYVGHSHRDQRVIVAFKGSNNTHDMIDTDLFNDLKLSTHYHSSCQFGSRSAKAHLGFCEYYSSLNDGSADGGSLEDAIEKVHKAYPAYSVWFTGHSLGGAAAAMQAVQFSDSTGVKPHLLTFGEPRVGDSSFASLVNSMTASATRVTHKRDLVPHVSPCCAWLGDASCSKDSACPFHHGREVWYADGMVSGNDNYRICSAEGEDVQCSNALSDTTSVSDHLHYFDHPVGSCCDSDLEASLNTVLMAV